MKFSFALAACVLFLPALVNAQSNETPSPTAPAAPPGPTGPGGTTPAGPTVSAPPSNPGTIAPASSFASAVPSSSEQTSAASSTFSAALSSPVTTASASSLSSGSAGQTSTGTVTAGESMPAGSSLSGSNVAGTSATAATAPTSTNSPSVQAICPSTNTCVQVAPGGQLGYAPSNLPASNGTVVTFVFPSGSTDNSVTQSSFADPCVYLATSDGNPAGFDSGLQNGKLFSVKVTNDQLPIYFFSKQEKFCGQGMVGGINVPTSGNTYNAYLDAAKALGPNEKPVPDNGPVLGGVGAQAVGTPSPIPSSSASHLVPNGFVALLAAVLGVTLA